MRNNLKTKETESTLTNEGNKERNKKQALGAPDGDKTEISIDLHMHSHQGVRNSHYLVSTSIISNISKTFIESTQEYFRG